MSQEYTFQAETQQLLDILIHSLYTDRDIFLRELISNASDALNRIQFQQLTDSDVYQPDAPLEIRIRLDEEANTLSISDTGIGMTADEMIEHLGTIAKSGAKAFMQAMKEAQGSKHTQEIIGQFGVGFYSVFMIADKVEVISRSYLPDAEAFKWSATGGTSYTVEAAEREDRGTEIIVYLKEDATEYTHAWKIKEIIRKHSNYVAFPIYVGDDEEPTNEQNAIWRRNSSEISDEEYQSFYRNLTMDFGEPLHRIHMIADVPMQFYTLLYIPSSARPNMFSPRKEAGLQLYARKVLIQDYSKDLLPEYLSFVQGVVDTEDLPLNVSRESIQANRIIANLRKAISTKLLNDLKRMAKKDTEKFLPIYMEFGPYFKQGIATDSQAREDLEQLLFFNSSYDDDPEQFYSLADYVKRMREGQTSIYYILGEDFKSARRSPHLDAFRKRNIEVLYFTDPMDSPMLMGLHEFDGHPLHSVDEANINFDEISKTEEELDESGEKLEESVFNMVKGRFEIILGSRVKGVKESHSLVNNPARLVSEDQSDGRHMYRINRMLDRDYEMPIKTLELNPRHPLIHNLSQLLSSDGDNPLIDVVVEQIFETALLQDGIHPDPASMASRLNKIMQAATGSSQVDYEDVMPEIEPIHTMDDSNDDDEIELNVED
ncbi:molecular chaperone HtpG [Anaerolineales bacterium]